MATMRYGMYAPNFGDFADFQNLLALARDAEGAGWDGFFLWDHLVLAKGLPMIDPWIALAAIAATTQRLIIGPLITPVARRRPWKLAREVISLDRLSGGRAVLGVGLGEPAAAEFEAFGEDPDPGVRAEKLDEGLEVVAGLTSGTDFRHQGKHYRITDTEFMPKPIQDPRVPIWVAGFWPHRAPMRRAARWDGVFPLQAFPPDLASFTWSQLWPTPGALRDVVAFVDDHRPSRAGVFDVVATGATSTDEPRQAADLAASFEEAGATWWLEWLDDQRGSFADMRARVQAGPPRG
jgi:alkanesulfonate monooxygenase SsuD/methylene tetrahydromethanopterin reductase-like flavin-dependent oxidoreductase (luciferase family)